MFHVSPPTPSCSTESADSTEQSLPPSSPNHTTISPASLCSRTSHLTLTEVLTVSDSGPLSASTPKPPALSPSSLSTGTPRSRRSRRHRKSVAKRSSSSPGLSLRQTKLCPIRLPSTLPPQATPARTDGLPPLRLSRQRRLLQGPLTPATSDLTFGDPIQPLPTHLARIWFQNVQGISAAQDMSDASWLAQFAVDHDISILAMAETNLAWGNPSVRHCYHHKVRQSWPVSSSIHASSCEVARTAYQPGGVTLSVRNNWAGRMTSNYSDPHGRWTSTTLQGRAGSRLTLIVAYRVCQTTVDPRRDQTACVQQWRTLRTATNPNPQPRRQCLSDLTEFIKSVQSPTNPVLLMWDANEATTTRDMQTFLSNTGLVDIFESAYDTEALPSTSSRGSAKIDHIMASPVILPFIHRQGIETLGYGFPSDHRALYCDIDLASLLHGNAAYIEPPKRRGLQSRDPKATKLYLSHLEAYLEDHSFFSRLHKLRHLDDDDPLAPQLLETLDRDLTDGRLAAEKHVRRRVASAWSPALLQAKSTLLYWKLRLSAWLQPTISYHAAIDKLRKQAGLVDDTAQPCTERQFRQLIRQASKQYQHLLSNADSIRDDFLQVRAEALARAKNLDLAKTVCRLQNIERLIRQFNRIKAAYPLRIHGGLNHVLRPRPGTTTATEYEAIYDLEAVEQLLIDRNIRHFGQAEGTPPTATAFAQLMGLGVSPFSDQVLDGTADLSRISHPGMRRWLSRLLGTALPPFPSHITADELRDGFRAWKEGTSTSPSGLHLGHYRCTLGQFDPTPSDDASEPPPPSFSDRIMEAHADLINNAIHRNHVFDRWRRVDNCMLEKLPGRPYLHKLRVIHLFEADLNLVTGIWSRRINWNGEQHTAFNTEQWGSASGCRASDVAMLKRLSYEFAGLTRTDLATFDNDAMACYDRIVVSLATIRNRHLGLPVDAARLRSQCLQSHFYHIRTQLGVSDRTYTHTSTTPQHGTGQGSRGAPTDWRGQSTILLDALEGEPMVMVDPTGRRRLARKCDGYVDDVTAWTNRISQLLHDVRATNPDIYIERQLGYIAQDWEYLLTCSGGRLELTKCFYYLLRWTFADHGRARLIPTPPSSIVIRDSTDGRHYPIRQYPVDEAHRTLGAFLSPTGNESMAMDKLASKARWFAAHTRRSRLSAADVQLACQSKYVPAMAYILITSAVPEVQLQRIQSPATTQFAVSLGYNRHYPLALLHGPRRLGGAGLPDLYIEQGTQHMLFLLRHLRQPGRVGTAVQILLDWYQLQSGLGHSVWEDPSPPIEHYVHASWLNNTRIFLRSSGLSFSVDTFRYHSSRMSDRFLMDDALQWYSSSALTLEDINNCRLYLQVATLSDIASADGRTLQPSVLYSRQTVPYVSSHSLHRWPRQALPSPTAWRKWNAFLRRYTSSSHRLRDPLGPWYQLPPYRRWQWYYDVSTCTVIHVPSDEDLPSTEYVLHVHRLKWSAQSPQRLHLDQPHWDRRRRSCLPIDRIPHTSAIHFLPLRQDLPLPHPSRLPPSRDWTHPFRHFTVLDPDLLCTALSAGQELLAVSDGGQEATNGTFGWVLAVQDSVVAEGLGSAWGYPMQSHRAEAFGNIGVLLFLHSFLATLDQSSSGSRVVVGCDNESLLVNKLKGRYAFYDTPDRDALHTVHMLASQLPLLVRHAHVLGHQDTRGKRGKNLTHAERHNIRADALATSVLHSPFLLADASDPVPFPATTPYLLFDDQIVTSRDHIVLREALAERDYIEYLQQNKHWPDNLLDSVDWFSRQSILCRLPSATHRTISKLTHGWLPTNGRLHTVDSRHPTACPLCGEVETNAHLLTCPGQRTWQSDTLRELDDLLRSIRTAPDLSLSVIYHTECWLLAQSPDPSHPAYHSSIGDPGVPWSLVFTGHIPIHWVQLQCQSTGRTYTPHRGGHPWSRKLGTFLAHRTHKAWTIRNEVYHRSSQSDTTSAARHAVYLKIVALCQEKHRLLTTDQLYFDFDPHEFCRNQRQHRLQRWYDTAAEVFRSGLHRARQQIQLHTHDIRRFFSPASVVPTPPTL